MTSKKRINVPKEIGQLKVDVQHIKTRIDSVSANGNPGLEASLRDLYQQNKAIHADVKTMSGQITDLIQVTASDRAWKNWWKAGRELVKESKLLAICRSKAGVYSLLIVILLTLNSITHALGLDLNLQGLFHVISKLLGG